MSLFPSEKKVEYFSRFGRALKANNFSPERPPRHFSTSPAKEPSRILTQQEIEAKIETVTRRLEEASIPIQVAEMKESPFFKAISRDQRNRLEKPMILETPSPAHYHPKFGVVQKRSASTKLVTSRTTPKVKPVALPGCVDEDTLDCTRTEKKLNHSTMRSPKDFQEETYQTLLGIREGRRNSPDPPRKHVPTFEFQKQTRRIGIPLNTNYESHFDVTTKADRVTGPRFEKGLPRPEIFESLATVGGVYDYDISKVMHRIDTGAVHFDRMSPRVVQLKEKVGGESPDLWKIDAGLSLVKPHTHVRSPDIAKSPPRDDSWIRPFRESPKRVFINKTLTVEIKRRSMGSTRK